MKPVFKRGFTLVELIISVGLFAVVMLVAAGAYLVMLNLNREAQAYATGVNNLAFGLELMAREIRTGKNYTCARSSDGICREIQFTNSSGQTVYYSRLSRSSSGPVNTTTQAVQRFVSAVGNQQIPLTDETMVTISRLDFYLTGTASPPGDYLQPYVTFVLSGSVKIGATQTESFYIETSAAKRGTDL